MSILFFIQGDIHGNEVHWPSIRPRKRYTVLLRLTNHILNLDDHESTGGKELEDLPVTSDFADIATVATLGKKISIL